MLTTLLLAALIAISGCKTGDASPQNEEPQADEQVIDEEARTADAGANDGGSMMANCPMAVEGTAMRLERGEEGVAVEFSTDGDVEELRERVEQMAEVHNEGMMHHGDADRPGMHGRDGGRGDEGSQHRMPAEMMQLMAQTTAETATGEDGMTMWLIPDDPEKVDELFEQMENQMQMMNDGGDNCPMMLMMGGEMSDQQQD